MKNRVNPEKLPFAFTVTRGLEIDDVWPTLAAAVDAARKRYPHPSANIPIHAWFTDGTSSELPEEPLYSEDRSGWTSHEGATQVERELYGAPTPRQQLRLLLRRNPDADYWEKLVLRFADALLAHVDEQLRGIPKEEEDTDKMTFEDYENLPEGPIEFVDGIPSPKRWTINIEGRRRLGFTTIHEERDFLVGKSPEEVAAEYERRRAELRARPFVPSQVPFPNEPRED